MQTALGNAIPSHLLDPQLFDFKRLAPHALSGDVAAELDAALNHADPEGELLAPALVSISCR